MTPQPDFLITTAQESETEELSRLINSAYRGETSRQGWTTEADLLDGQRTDAVTLSATLRTPGQFILCLRERSNGPVLGCVFIELFENPLGIGCYLGMLTVNPQLQTRGLGKALMSAAENFARERGAQLVTLGVIQVRESLMAWYERRGYKKTEKTKPFPYGDVLFGIPKRDDLYFVMFEKGLKT